MLTLNCQAQALRQPLRLLNHDWVRDYEPSQSQQEYLRQCRCHSRRNQMTAVRLMPKLRPFLLATLATFTLLFLILLLFWVSREYPRQTWAIREFRPLLLLKEVYLFTLACGLASSSAPLSLLELPNLCHYLSVQQLIHDNSGFYLPSLLFVRSEMSPIDS